MVNPCSMGVCETGTSWPQPRSRTEQRDDRIWLHLRTVTAPTRIPRGHEAFCSCFVAVRSIWRNGNRHQEHSLTYRESRNSTTRIRRQCGGNRQAQVSSKKNRPPVVSASSRGSERRL